MTAERARPTVTKSETAFRTISEVATELGIAQHVLRYWEGRFPQLKPLQRAGNRRLYRPADIQLARRIHRLLTAEGYSIRGVQKLLLEDARPSLTKARTSAAGIDQTGDPVSEQTGHFPLSELQTIRTILRDALSS